MPKVLNRSTRTDDGYYQERHARLVLAVVLTLTVAGGIYLSVRGDTFGSKEDANAYWAALGASIIGSVVIYALISVVAEPKRAAVQARRSTEEAVKIAHAHFNQYFERSLPEQVFAVSDIPRPDFRVAFVDMLKTSSTYEMKGTSGKYTSYRLCRLQAKPEVRKLKTVSLVLLDPRKEDLLEANVTFRARKPGSAVRPSADLTTDDTLSDEGTKLRDEVFETLVALFDIRKSRPTKVYFHTDLPYYRTEHFDSGLLLTYYVGERDFHETLLFRNSARPFDAYTAAMGMTQTFAGDPITFDDNRFVAGAIVDEAGLVNKLRDLNCQHSVDDLRARVRARNASLDKKLTVAGLSKDELF